MELPEALRDRVRRPGAQDGIFGPKTLSSVEAFQRANHLAADGVVGPLTWTALLR